MSQVHLEGCTRRPKLPGRPRFRAAAGPPGDFVTAPIAGRSLVQLGSSCSTPPRGNVRRQSGFLPLLASGLALGLLQAGGLLAVPEGSAVFPRPLASNAPCGNRWSGGPPVTPRRTLRSAITLAGGPPVTPRRTLRSTVTLSGGPPVPLRRAYRSAVTLPSRLCTSAARSSSRMRVLKLCRSPSSFRRPTSPSFSVARSAWSGDNFRS
jgi:hypothetical protein